MHNTTHEGPAQLWAVFIWALAVLCGLMFLWSYATQPGDLGDPPSDWPEHSALSHSTTQPTLVMVVHPRCPCTHASISELARLMTQLKGRLDAIVVFVVPPGVEEAGWEDVELWDRAQHIPGVRVHRDMDGIEAHHFGAATSGQTLLFAPHGERVFNGGLTPSRGHEGNSIGREQIVALVRDMNSSTALSSSQVFGCPLNDESTP